MEPSQCNNENGKLTTKCKTVNNLFLKQIVKYE